MKREILFEKFSKKSEIDEQRASRDNRLRTKRRNESKKQTRHQRESKRTRHSKNKKKHDIK